MLSRTLDAGAGPNSSSHDSDLHMAEPKIIQGGMGVAVSNWRLARAVSQQGQMGVVSGTAIDLVLARRLQMGDLGGEMRRALAAFPIPEMAQRVVDAYFIPGGKAHDAPFKGTPMHSLKTPRALDELTVLGNFVEVYLAREGHDGAIGVNYLEKIQLPTLPSLYGAMLAGVVYILMGAGIPRAIPGIIDRLAVGDPVELRIDVREAASTEEYVTRFSPAEFWGGTPPILSRPKFLPIISSSILAQTLVKKASGAVNGFIVEGPTAGGHNAGPRGPLTLNERGEPIYGARDVPDLDAIGSHGLPFWLAGSYGSHEALEQALALGATGIQVGTACAYCAESGIAPEYKQRVLRESRLGTLDVKTDPLASPTGFPFKVIQLPGTVAESATYEARARVCDLGYLRHLYKTPQGGIGYRCPSEPVANYLAKGGDIKDTVGRTCVCNGLSTVVGIEQVRAGGVHEPAIMTSGDDVLHVARFLAPGRDSYTAAEVIRQLLGQEPSPIDAPCTEFVAPEPSLA